MQIKNNNIILVGPMASGKSSIGRALARSLRLEFVDSDAEIIQRTGADIPWIFDLEGEAGFRRREHAILVDLSQKQDIVLATGGGIVLNSENRILLTKMGLVIYLEVSIEEQIRRTEYDKSRPLLQTENLTQRLEEFHRVRHPFYQAIAALTVSTNKCTVSTVAAQILQTLQQNC